MSLTLRLNKYNKTTLGILSSTDVPEFIEQDFSIVRQLEFDTVFNFSTSYVELELDADENLLNQFRGTDNLYWWQGKNNLNSYIYGIEIKRGSNNIFVGEVLADSIIFNESTQKLLLTARDWFKFHYERLSETSITENIFDNLTDFLQTIFPTSDPEGSREQQNLIHGYIINVNNQSGAWSSIPSFILDAGILTYKHLLNEVQKHYGAFIFIDKNYKLNFINRSKYTNAPEPLDPAIEIKDYILESDYEEKPFSFNEFNALLINQATPSGNSTEISWRLFYYVDGILTEEKIFSEAALDSLPDDLKILDLRQELFVRGDGSAVPYSFYKGMGYRIFPQRTRNEIYADYEDLIDPPNEIKCTVKLSDNLRIDLLNKIWISNQASFGEFTAYAIEEMPLDNIFKLTLLRSSLRGAH